MVMSRFPPRDERDEMARPLEGSRRKRQTEGQIGNESQRVEGIHWRTSALVEQTTLTIRWTKLVHSGRA